MRKISHECPLALLSESRSFNDYDYALVHLFEQYPQYYQFFVESLKLGREVILDNSIFELGKSFDNDQFATWVERLQPTYYIIPDVLEDSKATIERLHNWVSKYNFLPGKKIGVVQGKTYEDLVECYQEIDRYCDVIAISFDYSYYESIFELTNKFKNWVYGRQSLIVKLVRERIINKKKPHHLLGCSLPQEFLFYQSNVYDFIQSIDTSSPIVHGLLEIYYDQYGLEKKESIKLFELIDAKVTDLQRVAINNNIKIFKQLVNGN